MKPVDDSPLRLAVLFWYYKEPDVCEQRLKELRRLNPEAKIFGLYGGDTGAAASFAALGRWLDDDWVYDVAHDAHWKWRNGDLMLADWFVRRGHALLWDSIVIIQWDVFTAAPVDRLFSPLARDDVYLPGLRRLDEVAGFWWWVRPQTPEGDAFAAFESALRRRDFVGDLWACQFLTAVLPRRFFEQFVEYPERESGFLEYKLPTFAKEHGFRCVSLPHLRVIWEKELVSHGRIVLSAGKLPIRSRAILSELMKHGGARMFHPVAKRYGGGVASIVLGAVEEEVRPVVEFCRRVTYGVVRRALRLQSRRR